MANSEGFRNGLRVCLVLMLVVLNAFVIKAQQWTGEYYILESNPQPGEAVTLVVSVGDANNQVPSQSALTVTIPYDTDLLSPEGTAEVEANNSFFVDTGESFSYSVEVDESVGEITLEIELTSQLTGSGYGELARIKGIMVLEDVLKKPYSGNENPSSEIKVFPNPLAIGSAKGQLNVVLPEDHLNLARLYNITGQLVVEQQFEVSQSTLTMDLSALSPGRYWLHVPGHKAFHSIAVDVR